MLQFLIIITQLEIWIVNLFIIIWQLIENKSKKWNVKIVFVRFERECIREEMGKRINEGKKGGSRSLIHN